ELQGPDRREQGGAGRRIAGGEGLHDAFLEELLESGAVFFGIGRGGIGNVSENFGREARNLVIIDSTILRECVADAKFTVANQSDDIAGPGFVDGFAVASEEF